MELYCYQAECGDAIRISFVGNDKKRHNIFLDSGYKRTYNKILKEEINTLIKREEKIDLWILSHIHNDHIGGVIEYIKAINNGELDDITKEWFYNLPQEVSKKRQNDIISLPMSIAQSDIISEYLTQNKDGQNDITTDINTYNIYGMKISILSPTPLVIEDLRNKYRKNIFPKKNEVDEVSFPISVFSNDYNKKLEEFNIEEYNEDNSLENKSSIAALFEFQNKKILWLADSHSSIVLNSLKQKGYSIKNPLICDYVILSHHASKGNNNIELFSVLKCFNYIISSSGNNKYNLPNKEVFARLLRNTNREKKKYSLYFTYADDILKNIFQVDGTDCEEKWNFRVVYSQEKYIYFQL